MMYRPQFLCPGDSVSIVSPASIINPDYVKGATGVLESWSLGVTVSSHCLDHSGVYSGTIDERMNDFRHALYDPAVKAVLCSRGGYGAVHLLDGLTHYVDILITQQGKVEIKNVKTLWKHGKPKANEFKEYLMNPVSISPFTNTLKKEWIPLPVMDEKDYGIFLEEYVLMDDPIANAAKNVKKEGKATKKKKKIYPNDPCPCNSGKKYKYCCGK